MYLKIAKLSKIGGRKVNQDACDYWFSSNLSCFVLSDGLGGHFGGEVASRLVVNSIQSRFMEYPQCNVAAIKMFLNVAEGAIIREQQKNNILRNMRATAVILIIDKANNVANWGHIGDSRLYFFRNGRVNYQTRDHSISQNMVDAGYLKTSELRTSQTRNQLYAALGNGDSSEIDVFPVNFHILEGDAFLMCSDGLWEYVEEHEMEAMLNSTSSASAWLSALEKQVLLRGNHTQDNYSAIAVWCAIPDDDNTLMPSGKIEIK